LKAVLTALTITVRATPPDRRREAASWLAKTMLTGRLIW
jgi:hypothetical protein